MALFGYPVAQENDADRGTEDWIRALAWSMGKSREPQIILKTDERNPFLGLARGEIRRRVKQLG